MENPSDLWTIHYSSTERIIYCNHLRQITQWIPPLELWPCDERLPYGWEKAIDSENRIYFINHKDSTCTYRKPNENTSNNLLEERTLAIGRSNTIGFGFVAGSEKPVVIRFVNEDGPSADKIFPGDQILSINGEDVKNSNRDYVINLIRSCDIVLNITVCQPGLNTSSTLLTASKKAHLKNKANKVRFAESVSLQPEPNAENQNSFISNFLKVILENGQTKSFKYDSSTTVQEVIDLLIDKLSLKERNMFGLVLEHVKGFKRKKFYYMDPKENISTIASRPGVDKLRCAFRLFYVPPSIRSIDDKNTMDYFFLQCCNDVRLERFSPEIPVNMLLHLAALQIRYNLLNLENSSASKITLKSIENFGLENCLPKSILESMKSKELNKLLLHFLSSESDIYELPIKDLSKKQIIFQYLHTISSLPSYGTLCFNIFENDNDIILLVNPRFGINVLEEDGKTKNVMKIESIQRIQIEIDDNDYSAIYCDVENGSQVKIIMESLDGLEFAAVLNGYKLYLTGYSIDMVCKSNCIQPPMYNSWHNVYVNSWNYSPDVLLTMATINFLNIPTCPDNFANNISNKEYTIINENGQENNHDFLANNSVDSIRHNSTIESFLEKCVIPLPSATNYIREISSEELLSYIIPPPPPVEIDNQQTRNEFELPPKNVTKEPPKLPPKSNSIKYKEWIHNINDILARIDFQISQSTWADTEIDDSNCNYEDLKAMSLNLLTSSKLLVVCLSENDEKNSTSYLKLTLISISNILDKISGTKYESGHKMKNILEKLRDILLNIQVMLANNSNKDYLTSRAEELALHLATFLRILK